MEQKNIGKFISNLRKQKGLTQYELGMIIGVSSKTISKWETGISQPDITILKKISNVLEVSVDELLEGKKYDTIIKERKKHPILIISIIILIIMITSISINILKKEKEEQKEKSKEVCTMIKTFDIYNITKSNDGNFLYITIHEYQVEGTYTIKLPKTISKDLEVGKAYEFTFKINKEFEDAQTDILFNNSEILNVEYTDKLGMERTSISNCIH